MACTTLIGRTEQLATLRAALNSARGSAGGVALITGEAGIGKSRLVHELGTGEQDVDALLRGRGVPGGDVYAYRPLVEALHDVLRSRPPPSQAELTPFLGTLVRLVPGWASAEPPLEAELESPAAVGEAVLRLLRLLAGDGVCLLVLEDLHWADSGTLATLEYLADNLTREPVLCLGTLRPEPGADAVAVARRLAARRACLVVDLAPLSPADVAAMVADCLGGTPPEGLVDYVAGLADGVPFLVEELLASAAAGGGLVDSGTGWTVTRPLEPAVPWTFAEAVRQRLAELSGGRRRVVEAAAVLGRRFAWELLAESADVAPGEVLEALRDAVALQLLDSGGGEFRFRHALTRDAVLAQLLAPERAMLSRRALSAVCAASHVLGSGWRAVAADLAEHAGERDRAARLLADEGTDAVRGGALRAAESLLSRARRLIQQDESLRDEIDDRLTEALAKAGRARDVLEIGEPLLRRLTAAGAPTARLTAVHLRLVRAAVDARAWDDVRRHLAAARRLTDGSADATLLGPVAAAAAHARWEQADITGAAESAQVALSWGRAAGDHETGCEALQVLGRCARERDFAEAERLFTQALDIAEQQGLTLWRLRALQELGTLEVVDVRPLRRLPQARDLAMEQGALATAAMVELHLIPGFAQRGAYQDALDAAARCHGLARQLGLTALLPFASVWQATALAYAGRREEVAAVLKEAGLPGSADAVAACAAWGALGVASLVEEDRPRAHRELDQAAALWHASSDTGPLWSLRVLLRAVDGLDVQPAYQEVRQSAAATLRTNRALLGFADAVLLGRDGQSAAAQDAFAAADAVMAPIDWFRRLALRLTAEAALTDGWGQPAAWLRAALELFEADGQRAAASACRSLLHRIGVPVPRRLRRDDGLAPRLKALGITSREAEVLDLIGHGLSNREIAERLYLSPRTVETHVAHLLRKTRASSRAGLIALSVRRPPP